MRDYRQFLYMYNLSANSLIAKVLINNLWGCVDRIALSRPNTWEISEWVWW